METSLIVAIVAACISAGSAVVALMNLWRTHLSPFKLLIGVGDLQIRATPDEGGVSVQFLIPINIVNAGARFGRLRGVRIDLGQADPSFRRRYAYVMEEISDIKGLDLTSANRIPWSQQFIEPKKTVSRTLSIFYKTERPLGGEEVIFSLDVLSDERTGWHRKAEWKTIALRPELFVLLANGGGVFGVPIVGARELTDETKS